MVCAILVFVVVHPGPIVEKKMPSMLGVMKNKLPGRKSRVPKDSMKDTLITETGPRGSYAELEPYRSGKGGD